MNLAVFSHKLFRTHNHRYVTDGGFVIQISTIASLFDKTSVVVPVSNNIESQDGSSFTDSNIELIPTQQPKGRGWTRKLGVWVWFLQNFKLLSSIARKSDVIHVPIPSDIGTLGIILAKIYRKKLFIRFCGNWENRRTVAEKLWHLGMRFWKPPHTVTLATGGGVQPPDPRSPWIKWVFATTLSRSQCELLNRKAIRKEYSPKAPKLVFAGRLEKGKGVDVAIMSLKEIRHTYPGATLTILGDGSLKGELEILVDNFSIEGVVFRGLVTHKDLLDIFIHSHAMIFPSQSEGFPKVVQEALTSGLPVICNAVSVLRSLINQTNGRIHDRLDARSIASSFDQIYASPETYFQCVNSAINSAKTFTLEEWQQIIHDQLAQYWGELRTGD